MDYSELNAEEKAGRKAIADSMRGMILSQMPVQSSDETSLITDYRGFYLQISFSPLHPLMVFSFAKALQKPLSKRQYELMNELNLKSILGCHAVNDEAECYSYRAAHWLDSDISGKRFFEILNRCLEEAERGYYRLINN